MTFSDFDQPFLLCTDGSKDSGSGAALHQLDENGNKRPILHLSKDFSLAEENYHSVELETAALVHSAIFNSFKDTELGKRPLLSQLLAQNAQIALFARKAQVTQIASHVFQQLKTLQLANPANPPKGSRDASLQPHGETESHPPPQDENPSLACGSRTCSVKAQYTAYGRVILMKASEKSTVLHSS
ncbi:uncharacterized protein LY89DRAFT_670661 [Mollisia scopiformis]|uniref:Reverse transcriptase RNase H-like domain-containing protein n=1 Tax=Mollisia scopiformis TaxID=149040 RepID=A0A194X5T3_MOLSC|nr:uncharacterized protein LY89DRAFT_670661 [Mollisia scopiformis]KUJ15157.1 hypothetical protein LY89DRAFT_670661 [Mollisia scopiformis]